MPGAGASGRSDRTGPGGFGPVGSARWHGSALPVGGGVGDQPGEQRCVLGATGEQLGVPLHRHQPGCVLVLDGLDDTVGSSGHDAETRSGPVDGLVVEILMTPNI